MLLKADRRTSYNVTAVVFILFKPIVQPNELFMLSNHKEIRLCVAGQWRSRMDGKLDFVFFAERIRYVDEKVIIT